MWKNKTLPNLTEYYPQTNSSIQLQSYPQLTDHKQQFINIDHEITQWQPYKYENKQQISFDLKNQQNNNNHINVDDCVKKIKKYGLSKNCSQVSIKTMKDIMIIQLEENQQLRVCLFKTEKTIKDMYELAKNIQIQFGNFLKINSHQLISNNNFLIQTPPNNRQHPQATQSIHHQNPYICHYKQNSPDEIKIIKNYINDLIFLSSHYKSLEFTHDKQRKLTKRQKKNDKKFTSILQQFNVKLQKSEQTISKLIISIKQKDSKIQQYHQQHRTMNIKIIDQKDQIQKLKRLNKNDIGQTHYLSMIKNLQYQLQKISHICKQYQNQLVKWEQMDTISKNKQQQLQHKIKQLEEQLSKANNTNNELMNNYAIISAKMQCNEQQIHSLYQNQQQLYKDKLRQYQNHLSILQKQRETSYQKLQQKIFNKSFEIQKLNSIKISLQNQLLQRTTIINDLHQQINKWKDKYEFLNRDSQTRIQQKQKQMEYLQQLKLITQQKYQQVVSELELMRCDMVTIIQQLKVKQLEVLTIKQQEKLKFMSSKYCQHCNKYITNSQYKIQKKFFTKEQSQKLQTNAIPQTQISQNSTNKFVDVNQMNVSPNFGDTHEGIIWKKFKRNSTMEDSHIQQQNESLHKRKLTEKDLNKKTLSTTPKLKKQKSSKVLKQEQNEQRYQKLLQTKNRENYDHSLIKIFKLPKVNPNQITNASQMKTMPRNKFNLQTFQNKMGKNQYLKNYDKKNRTMLR